ncbi:SLBB domain-containing protein [Geomonas sp. RF6]|uniref:SLBB domain-containing protein n=1 Tax=Geomonas sp. RF6 TaxID=2897342 RepID=UPI001E4E6EA3|nr:SLBB domain-containing protein [Geomonas sp. RF6]UFS69269.1 SLBB domain-containing protein [Geomonas sp. RF6]
MSLKCAMRWLVLLLLLLPLPSIAALLEETSGASGRDTTQGSSVGDFGLEGSYRSNPEVLPVEQSKDAREWPDEPDSAQRTVRLLAEPGDGEIYLSWYLAEKPRKLSAQPASGGGAKGQGAEGGRAEKVVRYQVLYRSDVEPGGKTVDVLKGNSCRLREVKNNRLYLIQVKGFGAAGQEVASSREIAVTPQSAEELGSPIERAFAKEVGSLQGTVKGGAKGGQKLQLNRRLTQFGYDFFKNSGETSSSDNLPVVPDYLIGPGDALRVDIWGALQGRHELVVNRDGVITIPKIGAVKVWGLTYEQARGVIEKAISRYYRNFDLNLTMGKLRTMQVYVVGEVQAPGVYTINSLSTAISALAAAGGPSKNGSLRSIRLVRGGSTVQELDLYDMFVSGDKTKDLRLQSGDTLFVPVIGPVAAVAGEARRPAIYELKGKTSVAEILKMAGGTTAAADSSRVQVERLSGNSRVILDYSGKSEQELSSLPVQDRDMVKVFPVFEAARGVVTLTGNVQHPGQYQYRPGMRLKDLIPDYGTLLPESYLSAVEITRLALPDRHRELISADLGKALAGSDPDNVELKDQDSVHVFSLWDMQEHPVVAITGQVVKPGEYPFYPHMTVRDLVSAAGSLKRNALLSNAELTRLEVQDGTAVATRSTVDLGKALAGDAAHNLTLQPDDMLIVRGITEWLEASDRFVVLSGEVRYPGTYSISKGERLSSVIRRAGGFTEKAYLKGARFTRKSVRESQQKRMDEVIARSEIEIMQKEGEISASASSKEEADAAKASLEGLLAALQKLKERKAEGRVVITLLPPDLMSSTDNDLELMGGDRLEVPMTPSEVTVMGQVYNPTSFVYKEGGTVSSYLRKSGGPTREAEDDDIYVVKADGSVASRQQSSFGMSWDENDKKWSFGGFMDRRVDPGDTIVVPQKLERTAWMRSIKDITTIVSQIALTAGTVYLWFK